MALKFLSDCSWCVKFKGVTPAHPADQLPFLVHPLPFLVHLIKKEAQNPKDEPHLLKIRHSGSRSSPYYPQRRHLVTTPNVS